MTKLFDQIFRLISGGLDNIIGGYRCNNNNNNVNIILGVQQTEEKTTRPEQLVKSDLTAGNFAKLVNFEPSWKCPSSLISWNSKQRG